MKEKSFVFYKNCTSPSNIVLSMVNNYTEVIFLLTVNNIKVDSNIYIYLNELYIYRGL
jgi:hypothetical protein